MKCRLVLLLIVVSISRGTLATPKPHVLSFGKWTTVKSFAGPGESQALELKIRALYVDGRAKGFTTGAPHEITDRVFVVRHVMRLNDSLPEESNAPRWIWQLGGWLLVDRLTGRSSPVDLPQFDPVASSVSWYRDYAAYCGRSENGRKIFVVVAQLGRKKPILSKVMEEAKDEVSGSACASPTWQRQPPRVTFALGKDQEFTYAVRGRVADAVKDEPDEEE